jgi:TraY domain
MKTNKRRAVPRRRAAGGGRKPRGQFRSKSAVLTTRITQQTRDALERAAAESKRSLSQEIEFRLRESLSPDDARARHVRAIGELTKLAAEEIERLTGVGWLTDQFTAEAVRHAVDQVLCHFAPQRESAVPARIEQMAAAMPGDAGVVYRRPASLGLMEASRLIALIESAPQLDPKGKLNAPLPNEWSDPFDPDRPFRRWQLFHDLRLAEDRRK